MWLRPTTKALLALHQLSPMEASPGQVAEVMTADFPRYSEKPYTYTDGQLLINTLVRKRLAERPGPVGLVYQLTPKGLARAARAREVIGMVQ